MMFRRFALLALVLLASLGFAHAQETFLPGVKRVVFLGDSITHGGHYIECIEAYAVTKFPDRKIEFINLGLPSETVSGLSEPGHAGGSFPRPDLHERLDRVLAQTKPDLVIACYGMNDGIYYPYGEERAAKFREGMLKLRAKVEAAGAKLVHMTPPTFDPYPIKKQTLPAGLAEYRSPYEGYNDVLDKYSAWLVEQRAKGWDVVDIHTPMNDYLKEHRVANPAFILAADGVHASVLGHWIMARELLIHWGAPTSLRGMTNVADMLNTHPKAATVLKLVAQKQHVLRDSWLTATKHLRPGMGKGLPLDEAQVKAEALDAQLRAIAAPFPGKKSAWNGYDRYDFTVDGKPVLVVVPRHAAPGKPWVWHGEFFGHKPAPDIALLGKGFHIVYMSVPDMLGAPEAVEHWNALHAELTKQYGFNQKAALVGLSRGGLYCYNWAAANPDHVSCIYADAPVCDFKSWPGGKGKGKGSPGDWKLVLQRYHFNTEAEALAYTKNPIDNLEPLAKAKVPLLHVYGDADDVVPWDENTGIIAERYKKLGGDITLIAKPGVGHHPHGLDDSTPIIDFIVKSAQR